MAKVRLKIDVGGTVGDAAWRAIRHFDPIQEASFGPEHGAGKGYVAGSTAPQPAGAWCGALVTVQTSLVAQYAMSHYLEQPRVLDADVE